MDEKEILSWEKCYELGRKLSAAIRASGYTPEYLIGIAIGGLVPLTIVSRALQLSDVAVISARSYDGKTQGELNVTALPDIDLAGKKVLLIDEVVDNGTTMKKISEILKDDYQAGEVKTAVLVYKPHSQFKPDFYMLQTDKWVEFPWDSTPPNNV